MERDFVDINKEPAIGVNLSGKTAKVYVTAKGKDNKYKWYYKNSGSKSFSKSSVTSSTYLTKMTSKSKGRQVYCVIKDKYGCKTKSNIATLKMK